MNQKLIDCGVTTTHRDIRNRATLLLMAKDHENSPLSVLKNNPGLLRMIIELTTEPVLPMLAFVPEYNNPRSDDKIVFAVQVKEGECAAIGIPFESMISKMNIITISHTMEDIESWVMTRELLVMMCGDRRDRSMSVWSHGKTRSISECIGISSEDSDLVTRSVGGLVCGKWIVAIHPDSVSAYCLSSRERKSSTVVPKKRKYSVISSSHNKPARMMLERGPSGIDVVDDVRMTKDGKTTLFVVATRYRNRSEEIREAVFGILDLSEFETDDMMDPYGVPVLTQLHTISSCTKVRCATISPNGCTIFTVSDFDATSVEICVIDGNISKKMIVSRTEKIPMRIVALSSRSFFISKRIADVYDVEIRSFDSQETIALTGIAWMEQHDILLFACDGSNIIAIDVTSLRIIGKGILPNMFRSHCAPRKHCLSKTRGGLSCVKLGDVVCTYY